MEDPFGRPPTPWWRHLWRRLRGGGRAESAPARYLIPATTAGGLAGLSLPSAHGHIDRIVVFGLVAALPPALVDMWWKQRRRRASERLLVFPEAGKTESG